MTIDLIRLGEGYEKVVYIDPSSEDSEEISCVYIREKRSGALSREIAAMEKIREKALSSHKPTDRLAIEFEIDRRFSDKTIKSPQALTDLEQLISRKDLSLPERFDLVEQELATVGQLHSLKMEHGDLKPSNILVFKKDNQLVLKLSDWSKTKKSSFRSFYSGNPQFAAPEKHSSQKAEVYSTALVMIRTLEESLSSTGEAEIDAIRIRGIEKHRVEAGSVCYKNTVAGFFLSLLNACFLIKGKEQHLIHEYTDTIIDQLEIPNHPQKDETLDSLKKLLHEMTLDDPEKRPSLSEANQRYQEIKKGLLEICRPSQEAFRKTAEAVAEVAKNALAAAPKVSIELATNDPVPPSLAKRFLTVLRSTYCRITAYFWNLQANPSLVALFPFYNN